LKEVVVECDLTEWSEQKYRYDDVVHELSEILDRLGNSYEGLKSLNGHCVFPTEVDRARVKNLAEEYLDAVVRHKDFIQDHDILRNAVAKKIMSYVEFEQFCFDWHYWQLFRRNLADDMENQEQALEMIAAAVQTSSDDDDSWDTDEE
jgi:hypothetical protein